MFPEPHFGERTGVSSVVDFNGKTGCDFERSLDINAFRVLCVDFLPAKIRRKYQPMRFAIDASRQTNSDSLAKNLRMRFAQVLNAICQLTEKYLRIRSCRN